jgi:hypothetical protein
VGKKSVQAERRNRLEKIRQEQRKKERRRSLLIYGGAGVAALGILAAAIIPPVLSNYRERKTHRVGYVHAATKAASAAGCTGVVNDRQVGRNHVSATQTVTYAASPPSSGNHDADPMPDAVHFYARADKPRLERAVHNLEHGFVVAWYDPDLPAAQVTKLKNYAAKASTRFIAVPWNRGTFPANRHFVLTAWDRTQRCTSVSPAAIDDFLKAWADPDIAGAKWNSPTAPESGAAGGTLTPATSTPTSTPTPTARSSAGTASPSTGSATPSTGATGATSSGASPNPAASP